MNKEKFLKELKRTRSQAESLMYSLHYLLEETVYDARDYVDNELMKPIFDELDNQEQAVMNGEVSDSRRVKDGDEPYHNKRYQIITYAGDIGYDEKYDSDDLNELKQDVKEFKKTEDEVGIADYDTGEWVYIYSKWGRHHFTLEKVFPLSESLANRHSRALERLDKENAERNTEKDWLS